MIIRKSKLEDSLKIMDIFSEAQKYLKENNIDQWQNNYPNIEKIEEDIRNEEGYVMEIQGKILGTFVMSFQKEESYENYPDSWLSTEAYSVIHRLGILNEEKGRNLALKVLDFVKEKSIEKNIFSIKIDTHMDNLSMRRYLEKNGFINCGIIIINDGTERVAYQLKF